MEMKLFIIPEMEVPEQTESQSGLRNMPQFQILLGSSIVLLYIDQIQM